MRKRTHIGLAIITIFYLVLQISICTATIPKIEPYVNDFAHILTQTEIDTLNIQADKIEQNTTYEIAIVIVQNTGGEDKIQFANEIGDQNGVGKKGKDNGVVVLWSVEDGGAIATGRYSESILNDAKVSRIGKAARPYFDNKSYYEGFSYILTQINGEITSYEPTNSSDKSLLNTSSSGGNSLLLILIIIGAIILMFKIFSSTDVVEGAVAGSILSSGSRSSGGSSSSSRSSGGFGSGGFGGGGSSF